MGLLKRSYLTGYFKRETTDKEVTTKIILTIM